MGVITFEQISKFVKFCDAITSERNKVYKSEDMSLTTNALGFPVKFKPVILMSLDMERYLHERAGARFAEGENRQVYFCGIRVINVIIDGYLAFTWEATA